MNWVISLGLLILTGTVFAQPPAFRQHIAPLLEAKCLRCHSGARPKGELNLSSAAGLRQGGSSGRPLDSMAPRQGLLWEVLQQKKMPPKEKLSDAELATLLRWIDSGAAWEGGDLRLTPKSPPQQQRADAQWWSLQPIRAPIVPSGLNSDWAQQPLDAFILAKLREQSLSPSPAADRRTYLRRVTFDLIGLPPTPEEIRAFESDTAPNAFEKVVDRLLASPQYGERWGRHWLDVVRFGESHGYETNELRRNAWPYRDWVIRAFNDDLPFERFVLEQLAGDVVAGGNPQIEVATGFLVGGTHDIVGNETPDGKAQQRQDDLYDMIATTGSAFLGLTVHCARCHDHKFDPIPQRDYYALQAVFAGVQHSTRQLKDPAAEQQLQALAEQRKPLQEQLARLEEATSAYGPPRPALNTERFAAVTAKFVRFTVHTTARNDEPCLDELEIWSAGEKPVNVALATGGAKPSASSAFPDQTLHRIEHLNDGKVGNSKSWISNEKGGGWAQIELARPTRIDRIVWGRDRERKFTDRLATRYTIAVSLDGQDWTTIASQETRKKKPENGAESEQLGKLKELTRQLKKLDQETETTRSRLTVYCGQFTTPHPVHLLKRGDPLQPGELVNPAALSAIGKPISLSPTASEGQRRKALAQWITDRSNPLPARVMVNRLWHYHFGRGLVGTPSDFGFNGEKPSHPELLDWLAAEFLRKGGRLKPIHRLIVLSNTYRQTSTPTESVRQAAEKIDSDNRLLWRSPRRRLEAEALRDSILSVSGSLDKRMGGPGYDLWEYSNYVVVFKPKNPLPPDAFRRMVYQFKPRTQQDGTFGAFDCPDASMTMPRRNVSTTPLQALNLLNSPFMKDQARRWSNRLRADAGENLPAQIDRAFWLAFGRPPSQREASQALRIARDQGLETVCRALLNANEFLFVD